MKISRRKFVFFSISSLSLSLISFTGLYIWRKNVLPQEELKLFFSNFKKIIPLESLPSVSIQTSQLENNIISMLSDRELKIQKVILIKK